jgi:enoyl-CoA hydratase/carnithine racemase
MSDTVLCEIDGPLAIVTLNRPDARNAISDELREALRSLLETLSADPAVRVIAFTGAGSAFCAGGDVHAMRERLEAPPGRVAFDGWRRQQRTFGLSSTIHHLDQVTIAAVNGPAVGLGFDLALACDFIVASPEAMFSASFIARGLISDGGGLYHLPRRVGMQRAKELLFSGRRVDASEAAKLGIADVLASERSLLDEVRVFAEPFSNQPRAALTLMKSILNRSFEQTLEGIGALGSEAQAICYSTDDHRESVEAFLAPKP